MEEGGRISSCVKISSTRVVDPNPQVDKDVGGVGKWFIMGEINKKKKNVEVEKKEVNGEL